MAGTGKKGSAGAGGPPQASFDEPHGVYVHPSGTLYIVDSMNDRVFKLEEVILLYDTHRPAFLGCPGVFRPHAGASDSPTARQWRRLLGLWRGVYYDPDHNAFYLVYRLRRPRGVPPDRGAELRIARSVDGLHFEDVWASTKDQLSTDSIDRRALVRRRRVVGCSTSVMWTRWTSAGASTWWKRRGPTASISPRPAGATVTRRPYQGVKDSWIFRVGGLYHML